MSEPFCNDLRADTGSKQVRSMRVTEIVESQPDSHAFGEFEVEACEGFGIPNRSAGCSEQQAVLFVEILQISFLSELTRPMIGELSGTLRTEGLDSWRAGIY